MTHKLRSFFTGKDGKIAIWQFPNIPLWGWIVFTILAMFISKGKAHTGLHFLADASLVTWAYLEIRSGLSMFRRVLGSVVLVITVVSYFK